MKMRIVSSFALFTLACSSILNGQIPQIAQSSRALYAPLDSIGTDLASKSSMDLVPLFELKNNWVHSYLDLAGADYNVIADSIQIKVPEHAGALSYGYFFQHHQSSSWEPKRILFIIENGPFWHRQLSARIWLDRNHNLDFTDEKPEVLTKGRSTRPISFSEGNQFTSGVNIQVFPESKFYRFSKMNDVSINEMQGNRKFIGTGNSLKVDRINIRYAPFKFRSDTLLIGILDANSNGSFNDVGIDQWLISPGANPVLSTKDKVAVGPKSEFAWMGYAYKLALDSTAGIIGGVSLTPSLKARKSHKSLLNGAKIPRFRFCIAQKNAKKMNSRKLPKKPTVFVVWSAENEEFLKDSSYLHQLARIHKESFNWVFLNFGGSGKYVSYYNRRYDINPLQGFCNSRIAQKLRLQHLPQFMVWDERKKLIFNSNNVQDLGAQIEIIKK